MKLVLLVIAIALAGCTQNINDYTPALAAYGALAEKWNNVSENFTAFSVDGKPLYVTNRLFADEAPCDGKMAPTIRCGDVIISVPTADAVVNDIVFFSITADEAKAFTEKQGGTVWRRVSRIADRGYVMKADAFGSTHAFLVPKERVTKKMTGMIIGAEKAAGMEKTEDEGNLAALNALSKKWNSFVFSVFEGKTPEGYAFYYSRNLTPAPLKCTGSMKPNIDCGDLVLETEPTNLVKGDIIAFKIAPNQSSGFLPSSDEEQYIMHRIYRIDEKGYISKGDNTKTNEITDAIYIQKEDILGKAALIMKNSFESSVRTNG